MHKPFFWRCITRVAKLEGQGCAFRTDGDLALIVIESYWGCLRVPLKVYYKGTIRVHLKGSIRDMGSLQ